MFKKMLFFFGLTLLMLLQACTSPPNDNLATELGLTVYYEDNLVDIAIPSYNGQAIVGVRLGTNSLASDVSAGGLPDPLVMSALANFATYSKDSLTSNTHKPSLCATHTHADLSAAAESLKMNSLKSTNALRSSLSAPSALVNDSTTETYFYVLQDDLTFEIEPAVRKYNGDHCYIFVHEDADSTVSQGTINAIGDYFDDIIYARATDYFNVTPNDVDNNDKTIIYYTNMSALGFFVWWDLTSGIGSNQADMLYINLDYVLSSNSYTPAENSRIIAHEFQHLLNRTKRLNEGSTTQFETWIEEGIAEGATKYVLDNGALDYHFDDIATDSYIKNGLGFISWAGIGQNYSMAFTFLEYARIQSGMGVEFYEQLMNNFTVGYDYEAVFDIVEDNTSAFETFDDLMRDYKLAIIVNEDDGKYSFGNSSGNEYKYDLSPVQSPTYSTASLGVGGSLYFEYSDENTQDFLDFVPYNIGSNDIYYYRINAEE